MTPPLIKRLGLQAYLPVWENMRVFTRQRDDTIQDEIWIVEHPPVFTQGRVGKDEHIRDTANIPIIHSDRGGQVTYHGPGQIVIYLLLNLPRLNLGIRSLVALLENSVIQMLNEFGISSSGSLEAPGVYVNQAKIASIGLRVRKGFTYHGLAFNFKMDLTPFSYINPCGYENLSVTQLYDLLQNKTPSQAFIEDKILFFLTNSIRQCKYDQ